MSKNASRVNCGPRSASPFGRGGGYLARSVATEVFLDRALQNTATGAANTQSRLWRDEAPQKPLTADELASQMQRLCEKKGFRIKQRTGK